MVFSEIGQLQVVKKRDEISSHLAFCWSAIVLAWNSVPLDSVTGRGTAERNLAANSTGVRRKCPLENPSYAVIDQERCMNDGLVCSLGLGK